MPGAALTFNQPPPDIVDTEVVKFSVPEPGFKTAMVCGEVAVPPDTASNVRPVCESSMLGCVPDTTATTEIGVELKDNVTVPEYVPGGSCEGSAVMARENVPKEGTEPPVDESFSQLPPALVTTEAENWSAWPL